ncbi:MAG TPA: ATP-binding protein [Actinomycetota bacterium]|nr:ATP-binding protein [Actinomycetota bacterium]
MHIYLLGLALLVAVAGVAALLYVRANRVHEAAVEATRAAGFSARLASAEIARSIGELKTVTTDLAATPDLEALLEAPKNCSLTFSGVGIFPQGRLEVVGPDGAVLCSSEPARVSAQATHATAPWLEPARREATLEGPLPDPASGGSMLVHAVPSGRVVVAAFVQLEALGPVLADRFGGPSGFEFLVLDESGTEIVARSIDTRRWTGEPVPGGPWPTDVDTFQRTDLVGRARYYGRSSVTDPGWSVYAGVDRAAVLAPAEDLFRKTAWIIAIGVLLTFAALWIVWRQVARPIRSLGAAVKGAAVDPDAESMQIAGPAEVRQLGADFQRLLRSVSHELAERRRAEAALRNSERTYRLLFEKNPEPMWIYDRDTLRFLEVNDTACDHYGYAREEWLNMTVRDIRPAEEVPAMLDSVAASGPVDRSGPWRHLKANGQEIEVEITSHEIDFESHPGRFVLAHDVTKRRQLEKQLQQSQRLESLGQLAGGIAHDFNNLLSVIQNYSIFVKEALAEASPSEEMEAAIEDIEQISNAAKRAGSLTQRLLTFARQEVAHPEVVNPNEIIQEVEKLLKRTIGEEVDFRSVVEEGVRPVRIDPSQLQQVIMNLAVNARDAMPDGGALKIETENIDVDQSYASGFRDLRPGRFVRIRVSDSGTGMPPEVVERIFEPFFTTKDVGQGTGLGLATVHGIVAQAGGAIHVYSEPGMGTAMSVLLPATDEAETLEKPEVVRTLSGHETLLVVEDDAAIREVMRRLLTRQGYEVIVAASGAEAIEIAEDRTRAIDVVITDVVMPGMMGKEITERIAALRPETRLIYMSGYAQSVLDSRGRLEAGRRLVEKPFTETALLTVVRESLDEPDR